MNDLIERLRLGDGTSPDHKLLLEAADALEALAKEKALQDLHDENERLGLYKDAYAQPEQEPVAWQVMVEDEAMKEFSIKDMAHDWCVQQKLSGSSYIYWIRPLYTHPLQRTWVGLAPEDTFKIGERLGLSDIAWVDLMQAIEAKLKEKNI